MNFDNPTYEDQQDGKPDADALPGNNYKIRKVDFIFDYKLDKIFYVRIYIHRISGNQKEMQGWRDTLDKHVITVSARMTPRMSPLLVSR